MIAGAMEALKVGDPSELATDVGPVIDEAAKTAARRAPRMARQERQEDLPAEAARRRPRNGCFVAPAFYEIQVAKPIESREFWPDPPRHPLRRRTSSTRWSRQINATGYGLTLGLQSRIDTVRDYVEEHARVGNFYVNRNQIGAVVESQPFGGEGLSGTGPKAGGPHYVARFATERVTCIDTTAAGGNASLMAALEG